MSIGGFTFSLLLYLVYFNKSQKQRMPPEAEGMDLRNQDRISLLVSPVWLPRYHLTQPRTVSPGTRVTLGYAEFGLINLC